MNLIGLTLNLVVLGFYLFLVTLYFSKNNANNIDNHIYKYFLLDVFGLIVTEIIFLFTSYYIPNNIFIVGFFKRASFYCILVFFIILAYYILFVITENNKKWRDIMNNNKEKISKIILFALFVIAIFQFTLPINFHYNNSGVIDYVYGPATNDLASVISGLILFFVIPSIVINWKTINKKKLLPFLVTSILEVATLIINSIDLSLCFAAFSLTMACYMMYFTIENPDLKLITELQLAKSQAERSNKAKSDFLSSMSHEIRTPLNVIVGLSQMIKDSNDLEEIHNDSNDIVMASQNLLELVNSILDINKLQSNKMEIIETKYVPVAICDELMKLIQVRIGNKPIELITNYAKDLPSELYGDKEKIKQILVNLLTNAAKYTDKGTITLDVSSKIKKDNCLLTISVKDTGRGIKEEQKKFLFTQFYRLEEDKDTDIEGTGLGLALTKSLVDLLGGKITVDSKYMEGSTFTVVLPQKMVEAKADNSIDDLIDHSNEDFSNINDNDNNDDVNNNSELNDGESSGKILLVVDDNKLNLNVASRLLKDMNYDTDTVQSGFDCINMIQKDNRYDLIFMDIMMPSMNGVETMQKLKSMNNFNIPIIALTADATEGSREKYLNAGFDEYISKPINKEILEKTINKFLKH